MGGVEFVDRGPYVADRWGRKRSARVFRLFGTINPESIISNPGTIGLNNGQALPEYNSEWEGQRLEQYIVTVNGTLIEVTAIYTNDWFRPEVTVENITRTTAIPYAVRRAALQVGNVNRKYYWEPQSLNVSIACVRYTVKVRVDKDEYLANTAYVAAQKGKIHTIKVGGSAGVSTPGGTDVIAQFDVGTMSQVTNSLMEVSYSWITDPGNVILNAPLPAPDESGGIQLAWPVRNKSSGFPGDGNEYVRPPFATLVMVRQPIPIESTDEPNPAFRVFRPFVYDSAGPLGLPGYDPTAFLPLTIPGPGGGG